MTDKLLPLNAMEKVLKAGGAPRVAESAKAELKKVMEELASSIAKRAVHLSQHAGRRTVKAEDIKLALKEK